MAVGSFTDAVAGATQQQDPQELQRMKNLLRQQAETANKQFGAGGSAPMDVRPSLASDLSSNQAYNAGEYARRAKAAPAAYQAAKASDERQTNLGNLQQQAMWNRGQANQDIATQQSQMGRSQVMSAQELQQQMKQGLDKVGFSAASNEAERMDLISGAYFQGSAEMQLLDLANTNNLRMADIDKYFTLLETDLLNQIADIKAFSESDINAYMRSMDAKSTSMGNVINGISGIVASGIKYKYGA